jgi:iron-sulfur cluster insertion protein
MNTEPNLIVENSAASRISALREKEGKPELMLRVTVLGGGCSGFQYELGYEDTVQADDFVFGNGGAKIVTDATSMEFLNGATVYYEKSMMGEAFKIKNPNAASGCGCGKSFSVKN